VRAVFNCPGEAWARVYRDNCRVQDLHRRQPLAGPGTLKIAAALSTTIEYLVTGSDKTFSPLDPAALEIALTTAKLSPEGLKTLLYVAKGLLTQLPKT
jgi:hypothetical protein